PVVRQFWARATAKRPSNGGDGASGDAANWSVFAAPEFPTCAAGRSWVQRPQSSDTLCDAPAIEVSRATKPSRILPPTDGPHRIDPRSGMRGRSRLRADAKQ